MMTKLPLTLWFAAVHLIVSAKIGISFGANSAATHHRLRGQAADMATTTADKHQDHGGNGVGTHQETALTAAGRDATTERCYGTAGCVLRRHPRPRLRRARHPSLVPRSHGELLRVVPSGIAPRKLKLEPASRASASVRSRVAPSSRVSPGAASCDRAGPSQPKSARARDRLQPSGNAHFRVGPTGGAHETPGPMVCQHDARQHQVRRSECTWVWRVLST